MRAFRPLNIDQQITPVHTEQKAGWAPQLFGTLFGKYRQILVRAGNQTSDHPLAL